MESVEQDLSPEVELEPSSVDEQSTEQAEVPEQDTSFEDGFNATKGIETEAEPTPLFAGYTEAQIKDMFERVSEVDKLKERESKVFGTLGSLKQSIDQMRSQPAAAPAAKVQLNGALRRLEAEFPEMASLLREDLSEAFQGAQAGPTGADISGIVAQRVEQATRQFETKLVGMRHKDWRTVAQSPEFEQWKGTLPPDELHVVNESWDAEAVIDTLDKFKSWRDAAVQNRQNRQQRLQAAIVPKGNRQAATSTEQDAFLAGFKAVRGS